MINYKPVKTTFFPSTPFYLLYPRHNETINGGCSQPTVLRLFSHKSAYSTAHPSRPPPSRKKKTTTLLCIICTDKVPPESSFLNTSLLLYLFDFLHIKLGRLCAQRRMPLKINGLFWLLCLSEQFFCGILPSRSLYELRLASEAHTIKLFDLQFLSGF